MNNFRENCKSTCKTIYFLKNIGSSHRFFILRIFEDLFFDMIILKKCKGDSAWLGEKCKGKTLLVIEIFFILHCHSPVLLYTQYPKQNMIKFSLCLAELAQKFKFLWTNSVLRSDFMKRNYGRFIFNQQQPITDEYVMKDGLKELCFWVMWILLLFFTFCAIERIFIEQWHKYVLGWCIFTIGDLDKIVHKY